MNKQELIAKTAENAGLTKKQAAAAVDAVIAAIEDAVVAGEKVQLIGFGTFEKKTRAARTSRNPATGASVEVAEKTVPSFKAGKAFKDAVAK